MPATKEECIAALKRAAEALETSVERLYRDDYRRVRASGEPCAKLIARAFGSWRAAKCAAAGLSLPPHYHQHTIRDDEELPVQPVPPGYYAHQVTTGPSGQSIKARIDAPKADLVEPIGEGQRHVASTLVNGSGRIVQQWIKALPEKERRDQEAARIIAELPRIIAELPPATPLPTPTGIHDDDLMSAYVIGDHHFGMLAWGEETGTDYDLAIAQDMMRGAMRFLTWGTDAAKAVIVNVGDMVHADDESAMTRRSGHKLDVDTRWTKVLRATIVSVAAAIRSALESHTTVHAVMAPGNHDPHTARFLATALDIWYRDEPRVTIDTSPGARFYVEHGACLLGVTHGDKQKMTELESIMSAEMPQAWGRTKYRRWLCGHVHHKSVDKELRGCTVETFQTLAGKDAWHAEAGYMSERSMSRIDYHAVDGEVGRGRVTAARIQRWLDGG